MRGPLPFLGTLGLLLALGLSGCSKESPIRTSRFEAFDTSIDLSLVGVDEEKARRIGTELSGDFRDLDAAWHAWEPGSLEYLNERLPAKKAFAAPPAVLTLIQAAMPLAERSEHLFNPAIGKLLDLWGFHSDPPQCKPPPPAKQIERLVKANPRLGDLEISGILIKSSNPAVQLDFGPFAKGLAMDMAIARLREQGIRNALINAGGDVRAIGSRSGQPWRVPIRRGTGHGVLAMVEVRGDESVFTAAAHQRNFVYEGKAYHYLIDPRSGAPAEGAQSVTVLHRDAATAAAAASALFVAGPEGWHAIAQRMGIHQVLFVDSAGTVHLSPAMAERLQLLDKSVPIQVSAPLAAPPSAP